MRILTITYLRVYILRRLQLGTKTVCQGSTTGKPSQGPLREAAGRGLKGQGESYVRPHANVTIAASHQVWTLKRDGRVGRATRPSTFRRTAPAAHSPAVPRVLSSGHGASKPSLDLEARTKFELGGVGFGSEGRVRDRRNSGAHSGAFAPPPPSVVASGDDESRNPTPIQPQLAGAGSRALHENPPRG